MIALLCHLIGDYWLQSDWMAANKTKSFWPCYLHACAYSTAFFVAMLLGLLPFSWLALTVIGGTHFLIDRTRVATLICYVKNFMAPRSWWRRWENCKATGYLIGDPSKDPAAKPAWMAVWLMIITDNTLHVAINYAALRWL